MNYVGPYSPAAYNAANIIAGGGNGAPYNPAIIQAGQAINAAQPKAQAPASGGGGAASAAASGLSDTLSYLGDQANQLRGLLGRTNTALDQGLTRNNDQFNQQQGLVTQKHDSAIQDQTTQKQGAYDTIARNGGNGYRSLSQIIGRAAGQGSSAFQDLLPSVIGKDMSSQRLGASNTYGQNASKIDQSEQQSIADLVAQKKANEEDIRSKIESQRQSLNDQLAQNAGAVAQAKGGGYASIKAAQSPYQTAIENSRNAVEGLFNTFRTPYTAPNADPNLSAYTTDRTAINAQNQGIDPNSAYTSLLRKKLQGV